jgi:Protein of unknown function (DUF3168)
MAGLTEELEDAVLKVLRDDAPLTSLSSKHVFPAAERGMQMPYALYGPIDAASDFADCDQGYEVTIPIHVYARKNDARRASKMADAVQKALHDKDLAMPGHAVVVMDWRTTRGPLRDPDESTEHYVVEFLALVQATTV